MTHTCKKCGKPALFLFDGGLGKCCFTPEFKPSKTITRRGAYVVRLKSGLYLNSNSKPSRFVERDMAHVYKFLNMAKRAAKNERGKVEKVK